MTNFLTIEQFEALILTNIAITCLTLPSTMYVIIKYRKEKIDLFDLIFVWILGVIITLVVELILFSIYLICLDIVTNKITIGL